MQGVGVELVTVGNKGSTYFKKRQPGSEGKGVKTTVRASYACGQGPTAEEATTIANEARRRPSHVARGRESEHSIHWGLGGGSAGWRRPWPSPFPWWLRASCVGAPRSHGSGVCGRTQDEVPIRLG